LALAIGWRDHRQSASYDHGRRDHRHFDIKITVFTYKDKD